MNPGSAHYLPGASVQFSEGELARFTKYLSDELADALEDHDQREERLNEQDRMYLAEPAQRQRNFPWPGAANLEIPLIGFTTDSIVARIMNTIFSMEPFWTIRPLRREVDPFAKPVEHYLDWSRKAEFNFYRQAKPCIIQVTKHGWGWLKYGWETYTNREYFMDPESSDVSFQDTVVRRPAVYFVRNQDVIVQSGMENEEQAEFVIHRVRLTDNQMRMRAHDNIYEKVEEVIEKKEDIWHQMPGQDEEQAVRVKPKLNTLYEFSVDWIIDGVPVTLIATWHQPSKTLVRCIYSPYPWRNLTKLTFIEREGMLEGIGIARRLYQLQEELGTIHRQQVDNATVANTRFFLGKRGSVRTGTQIWPGKVQLVGDPERDMKAIQLGDIYPSMRALEVQALGYAERASGISDPQLGRESQALGSRATATGTLAMIQEGNRRFDLNVRDIRETLSEVGRRVLELNQLFRPKGASYFVEGEEGRYVEMLLDLPKEFSASKLAVELTASTATINRETEKQGLIGLLGVMSQYYDKLVQSAMVVANPNIPGEVKELIIRMSEGAKHIVKRIVQDFDIRDVDTVVPALLQNEATQDMMNGQGAGANFRSADMAQGAGGNGSMAGIPAVSGPVNPDGTRGAGGVGVIQ